MASFTLLLYFVGIMTGIYALLKLLDYFVAQVNVHKILCYFGIHKEEDWHPYGDSSIYKISRIKVKRCKYCHDHEWR